MELRGPELRLPLVAAWRRGDPAPTVGAFLQVLRAVVGE